jgi:hypothetical protein
MTGESIGKRFAVLGQSSFFQELQQVSLPVDREDVDGWLPGISAREAAWKRLQQSEI